MVDDQLGDKQIWECPQLRRPVQQHRSKKRAEARTEYLAYHDMLTGLPNRALFNDRLAGAIALAQRHNHSLGVLFLDLDGFKEVNDWFGHDGGDLLLKQVAARLAECIRESDTVARLGGDEFAVVLNELSGEHHAEGVAAKILRTLQRAFVVGGREVRILPASASRSSRSTTRTAAVC